jgi:DNA (cytosine-5)-methyltransferase 1
MPLTFGSLFAGIGGIDLGLERAGMVCKWQVERDSYCIGELTKHWPDILKYGDIKNVGKHNLEAVDCIAGGFPCQPVSLAGKRKAQADPRWLWSEFARVVDDLRPRYVLVENVPGLLLRGGNEVIADLATLGYDAEWDCIPASAFGAPHLRYRVFIVAYSPGMERKTGTKESGIIRQVFENRPERHYFSRSSEEISDTDQEREQGLSERERTQNASTRIGSKDVSNTNGKRQLQSQGERQH